MGWALKPSHSAEYQTKKWNILYRKFTDYRRPFLKNEKVIKISVHPVACVQPIHLYTGYTQAIHRLYTGYTSRSASFSFDPNSAKAEQAKTVFWQTCVFCSCLLAMPHLSGFYPKVNTVKSIRFNHRMEQRSLVRELKWVFQYWMIDGCHIQSSSVGCILLNKWFRMDRLRSA